MVVEKKQRKRGRRKGFRNGESPTAQAVRYMHEHRVSAQEAAERFGISDSNICGAISSGAYDDHGRYIGSRIENSKSGQAAAHVKKHECTLREAGRLFGVSHQAVQQAWSRLFPEEPVPTRLTRALVSQQIMELAEEGKTRSQIGAELDLPYGRVSGVCRYEDIDPLHAPLGFGELNEHAVTEVMKGEKTVAEVAAEFKMSHGHVMDLMWRRGIAVPHKKHPSAHWGRSAEALALMQREDLTIAEAARRFQIAPGSLRSYIQRRERAEDKKA